MLAAGIPADRTHGQHPVETEETIDGTDSFMTAKTRPDSSSIIIIVNQHRQSISPLAFIEVVERPFDIVCFLLFIDTASLAPAFHSRTLWDLNGLLSIK